MGKKLYRQETSGEIHALNPQSNYVTLPTSTIDLWMPLIGAVGVGVYALYCRLAREGRVRGSDLKRMAKAARIGDNTLRNLNQTLERIGFIKVEKPEGERRIRHYTTEIRLLEPPTQVPVELIRELECRSGYEILAHWLVESSEAGPAATNPPSGGCEPPAETIGAAPLPQVRSQGISGATLTRPPQAVAPMNIPPFPQPRPQEAGGGGLAASSQPAVRTNIPPFPFPRQGAGEDSHGAPSQPVPRTNIQPFPFPCQGAGEGNLSSSPQPAQTKIPPLPQPRPAASMIISPGRNPHASVPVGTLGQPVSLSSVIESVWQRQTALAGVSQPASERHHALNSAPLPAPERGHASADASGVAPQRVMEAPGSATLESLGIESLRGREESPLPLFRKNLKCPEPPSLPWKDFQKGQEAASPSNQPTSLSGQVFSSLRNGQGEHG